MIVVSISLLSDLHCPTLIVDSFLFDVDARHQDCGSFFHPNFPLPQARHVHNCHYARELFFCALSNFSVVQSNSCLHLVAKTLVLSSASSKVSTDVLAVLSEPRSFSIQAAALCLSSSSSMHSNKRFNKRTRTTRALPRRFEQSKMPFSFT